jgi:hypothetical protein
MRWTGSKKKNIEEAAMTSLSVNRKSDEFVHSMRPWFFGIPTFLVMSVFLTWLLARLASWIFAVLDVVK